MPDKAIGAHFAEHPALLGSQATIADFGLIGPLYAHLYRDPTAGKLMRERAPNVARWVEQLHFEPGGLRAPLDDNDSIPETLLPVLKRLAREMLPAMVDVAHHVRAWMAEHPGETLPRALGSHAFTLEGREGSRIIRPYSLWMIQRVRDHLNGMSAPERPGRGQPPPGGYVPARYRRRGADRLPGPAAPGPAQAHRAPGLTPG